VNKKTALYIYSSNVVKSSKTHQKFISATISRNILCAFHMFNESRCAVRWDKNCWPPFFTFYKPCNLKDETEPLLKHIAQETSLGSTCTRVRGGSGNK